VQQPGYATRQTSVRAQIGTHARTETQNEGIDIRTHRHTQAHTRTGRHRMKIETHAHTFGEAVRHVEGGTKLGAELFRRQLSTVQLPNPTHHT
jgi:hypothetical protein